MATHGMNRDMLRQLQRMQAQITKAQEEIEESTVEASAGGGAVTVVVSGQPRLQSIKIAPEAVDPDDVEMLEDMISVAGGLDVPGLT